ncbi:unnamed protein product [Allacma fusca]|uniref:Uncharacterized protein n=1 Tax=Allacma fusca TaxID=39272 RepID=A0A8J2P1R3_9HEXA|nr:unnamed protein product [Allacma fusca]
MHIFFNFGHRTYIQAKIQSQFLIPKRKINLNFGADDLFVLYNTPVRFLARLFPLRMSKVFLINEPVANKEHDVKESGFPYIPTWDVIQVCLGCTKSRYRRIISYSPNSNQFKVETDVATIIRESSASLSFDTMLFITPSSDASTQCSDIVRKISSDLHSVEYYEIPIGLAAVTLNFSCTVTSPRFLLRKFRKNETFSEAIAPIPIFIQMQDVDMDNHWLAQNDIRRRTASVTMVHDSLSFLVHLTHSEIKWEYYIFEALVQPFDSYTFWFSVVSILVVGLLATVISILHGGIKKGVPRRMDICEGFMMSYSILWQPQGMPIQEKRIFSRLIMPAFLIPGWILSTLFTSNMMAMIATTPATFTGPGTVESIMLDQKIKLAISSKSILTLNFQTKFEKRLVEVSTLSECVIGTIIKGFICISPEKKLLEAIFTLANNPLYAEEIARLYIISEEDFQLREIWKIPVYLGRMETFQEIMLRLQSSGIIQYKYSQASKQNQRNLFRLRSSLRDDSESRGISVDLFYIIFNKAFLLGIIIGMFVFCCENCADASKRRHGRSERSGRWSWESFELA